MESANVGGEPVVEVAGWNDHHFIAVVEHLRPKGIDALRHEAGPVRSGFDQCGERHGLGAGDADEDSILGLFPRFRSAHP